MIEKERESRRSNDREIGERKREDGGEREERDQIGGRFGEHSINCSTNTEN